MECFNDLLLKLRDIHEREVEGWQVKVQELSSKKGCDTKRMEELFTRNQQMKEQQRLLTENIKTLENRLRAGLCDRCTVTQEVAKRRQQEFEASQIQSLQHISLLAAEMNSLKKENKRLKDDIMNLKTALDMTGSWSRSHLTGGEARSHLNNRVAEVKGHSSPDTLPSLGPVALITGRAGEHPADADIVTVKTEEEQMSEEPDSRQLRTSRSHYDQYKSLLPLGLSLPSPWKTNRSPTSGRERRVSSVEGLDQRPSVSPQVLLRSSSSSMSGETKPSRHVLHVPVPCHPQPIKSSPVSLTWPLSEQSEWGPLVSAGTSSAISPSARLNVPLFSNLFPNSQHMTPRRQVFNPSWQKPSAPQASAKEPTVAFRLISLPDYAESQRGLREKKENQSSKVERTSEEACDAPLDLSDRGKPKSSQTPRESSPTLPQKARVQKSPDIALGEGSNRSSLSPSPVILNSSSSSPPGKQERDSTSDHDKQVDKEQTHKKEVNGKTDQSIDKKVPVLTISLRPVVVLETLNSALQKQEALSSNGVQSSTRDEPGSSTDELDEDESSSGQESGQTCKRKREAAATKANRDSDTINHHQEKKTKSTSRDEDKNP